MNAPGPPLREYIERVIKEHDRRYEQRFVAQEHAVRAALDSAALAVNKAEDATEKRLESMNLFREQARDRDRAYLTKDEFRAFREATSAQVRWIVGTGLSILALVVSFGIYLGAR